MNRRSIFFLIRRNPILFVFSAVFSFAVVAATVSGMAWYAYVLYARSITHKMLSDITGAEPVMERFAINPLSGEVSVKNLKIPNALVYENACKSSTLSYARNCSAAAEVASLKIVCDGISFVSERPEVSAFEIEIDELSAIRLSPQKFNVLELLKNASQYFSASKNGLKKVSVKINAGKRSEYSVLYLDFSSARDVIHLDRNEDFSFADTSGDGVDETLRRLCAAFSKNSAFAFLARAVDNYLEER